MNPILNGTRKGDIRGVVKFWKLVANPGQWLTNVGGPDQNAMNHIFNYYFTNEILKKTNCFLFYKLFLLCIFTKELIYNDF